MVDNRPQVISHQTVQYSGPIPSAEEFERYNTILPGAANRILMMAEKQAIHRQLLERRTITVAQIKSILGLICGFVIALLIVGGAIYIIVRGKSIAGLSALILAVASLVGVYIYGHKEQKEELNKNK